MDWPWITVTVQKLLLLVAATVTLQYTTTTAYGSGSSGSINRARPDCLDKCGNISIPYPFGTGKGCFQEPFNVACNESGAYLASTEVRILDINLILGEIRVQNPHIAWECKYTNGTNSTGGFEGLNLDSFHKVSGTKNKLIAIGCDTFAFIMGTTKGKNQLDFLTVNSCYSYCTDASSVDDNTECFGMGCCQTSFPGNISSFTTTSSPLVDNSTIQSFSPCSYSFVVEEDWFKFNGNNTMRSGGYNNRFAEGRHVFNNNNGTAHPNRFSGATGPNDRNSSGVDDAFLHKTVAAVVAAVTAAQKPPEQTAQHGAEGQGAVTNASAGSEPSGGVPQGGEPTEHIVQPQASQTQTHVTAPVADVPKPKEADGAGPTKKKKLDKNGCFRCKKPGHLIDDCTIPFCLYCESINHESADCQLLKAPKPSIILHGYACEELMFFELPCSETYKPKVENPRLAKVTVEGETMTIPDIIENLKRIVPYDNFIWEVYHFQNNVYRVKFPNKNEVQRLKIFGTYICPGRPSEMTFDFWSTLEEPLYMLPQVWMRVSGIPSDIRNDFLSMWGVGSMFGKTVEVDMAFTRRNKILRIKIGCINPSLIPDESDLFIKRGFFKLHFEVETVMVEQDAEMIEVNGGRKDEDGSDKASKEKEKDTDGKTTEMETDDANDHTGREVSNTMEISESEGQKGKQVALDRSFMEVKIGTFVSQIQLSDPVPNLVLPKCYGSATVWRSESHDRAQQEQLQSLSVATGQTSSDKTEVGTAAEVCPLVSVPTPRSSSPMIAVETVKSLDAEGGLLHTTPGVSSSLHMTKNKIHEYGRTLQPEKMKQTMQHTHMTHTSALPEQQKEANLTKISHPNSVPKKPSVEEVIAFGGIPRPTATEVRISERIGAQSDADLTQMERAMKKTQMRNSINSGDLLHGALDPTLGSPFTARATGCHGFWMHTAPDGRSGYLVPGWLAAY